VRIDTATIGPLEEFEKLAQGPIQVVIVKHRGATRDV
jgi:hypothetical protein